MGGEGWGRTLWKKGKRRKYTLKHEAERTLGEEEQEGQREDIQEAGKRVIRGGEAPSGQPFIQV